MLCDYCTDVCNVCFSFFFSCFLCSYTLRNAEYRLCLQKSLGSCDDDESGCWKNQLSTNSQKIHLNYGDGICENQSQEEESNYIDSNSLEYFHEGQQLIDDDAKTIEALGFMSEETRKYILNLKGKLNAVTKVCVWFIRKYNEALHDVWQNVFLITKWEES